MDLGLIVAPIFIYITFLSAMNMFLLKLFIVRNNIKKEAVAEYFDYVNPFVVLILLVFSLTDVSSPLSKTNKAYLAFHTGLAIVSGWSTLFYIRLLLTHSLLISQITGLFLVVLFIVALVYNLYSIFRFISFFIMLRK